MPGISEACSASAHAACVEPECRCGCHPIVKKLMEQQATRVTSTAPVAIPEAAALCPKCNRRWRPSDQFCRKDGTRLVMGVTCLECGSVGEPGDVFCWGCGTKLGEKRVASVEEITV